MATISQLMEGKAPGSVKVVCLGWDPGTYFIPYYRGVDLLEYWFGTNQDGKHFAFLTADENWTIYTEPKRCTCGAKMVAVPGLGRSSWVCALGSDCPDTAKYEHYITGEVE